MNINGTEYNNFIYKCSPGDSSGRGEQSGGR